MISPPPHGLRNKSKFLGKACDAAWAPPLRPPLTSPPPASWPSFRNVHRLDMECCSPPTSACSSFQTQNKGHWCSLTHSPLHPPSKTHRISFVTLLNPAHISITTPYFGLMHLITDLPVSPSEQEAHQQQEAH